MKWAAAHAKINLSLVVGPVRADGKHEIATVLQRIDLADLVSLVRNPGLEITGYPDDVLVRTALLTLAEAAGVEPHWSVEIQKRIPVAAGLGGGSSDAATALRLANATLMHPLPLEQLHSLAAEIGTDIPFFLASGPQLGTGDGTELAPAELPSDYVVVLVLPAGEQKASTAGVYESFSGEAGFADRRAALDGALSAGDIASLPPNDLASSPLAGELEELGAFRADVSGAGPAVYGLFSEQERAEAAREALAHRGQTWLTRPAWYG